MMRVGDYIGVDGGKGYNHGCQDYAVLKYIGAGQAVVLTANSCTSCWQVGHDRDHIFATEGDIWSVAEENVEPQDGSWDRAIRWQLK